MSRETEHVSDPELERRVAHLPRDIEPERDLWPAIHARLEPRGDAGSLADADRNPPAGRVVPGPWTAGQWVRQLAAALALMTLGGFLTWAWLGMPAQGHGTPETLAESDGQTASGERWAADSGAKPGSSDRDAGLELATAPRSATMGAVEAEYLRAKEVLWLSILAERDSLSPATQAVVERNLMIIDRAIRDLRVALEADPGNRGLQRMLIDNHRRSLDLLRRLAKEA